MWCRNNNLSNLNIRDNKLLEDLNCSGNQLTTLFVNKNTNLQQLNFSNNSLTQIDISNLSVIDTLDCGYNNLSALHFDNNNQLTTLYCNDNHLSTLDLNNLPSLREFTCYNNQITELDLRDNPNLELLYISNNLLNRLDIRNGNNSIITSFNALNNPDLFCVSVSDIDYAIAFWTDIDEGVTYSEANCYAALEEGLIAYYPFSNNANDVSGNFNHGTNNGASFTDDKQKHALSACYFNGTSWIEVDHSESINFDTNQDYSISLWTKIDADHQTGSILAKWDNSFDAYPYVIRCDNVNGKFRVYSASWDGDDQFIANVVNSENDGLLLEPDQYYHISVIYQSGTKFLYVNGQLIDTNSTSQGSITNNHNLYLGRRGVRDDRFFKGYMDEIRIYNRAISDTEILDLYQDGIDLVAHYPFNGNANDESYRANHGIVTGATLTTDRNGNPESAYYFDGVDDLIQVPDSLPITNHFTISFWALNEKEANDNSTILCDGGSSAGGNDFLINMNQNQIGFRADKNSSLNYEGGSTLLANLSLMNNWSYVIWVMNEGISTIYLNGTEVAQFEEIGSNKGYHDAFAYIGARHVWGGQADEYFKGKIDDIKLFNRPLSSDEIIQLYADGGTPTEINKKDVEKKSINVYPNPSTGIINIQTTSTALSDQKIAIYNMVGTLIYSTKITSSNTRIDISKFANSGLYLLKITNTKTGQREIMKIVLE